ncbi:Uncharacterised protein [Mycobacteroides abscessus subsp. abscessus]|nr:Uncharacterised protein [Mycobacteroides abscessus subsp. abscessus]
MQAPPYCHAVFPVTVIFVSFFFLIKRKYNSKSMKSSKSQGLISSRVLGPRPPTFLNWKRIGTVTKSV